LDQLCEEGAGDGSGSSSVDDGGSSSDQYDPEAAMREATEEMAKLQLKKQ
jgi:hypothetical protein